MPKIVKFELKVTQAWCLQGNLSYSNVKELHNGLTGPLWRWEYFLNSGGLGPEFLAISCPDNWGLDWVNV